jgi:DNA-binding response OmpR family regulator
VFGPKPMHTIMLIEDEEMVRKTLRLVLKGAGFQVLTASTVAEAKQVWGEKQNEIDLVITDNSLPDGSGIELVKDLEREKSGLKIIVASGLTHGELPSHYFQIQKPFNARFLLGFVKGAFGESGEKDR